jgi:hypothetical protein
MLRLSRGKSLTGVTNESFCSSSPRTDTVYKGHFGPEKGDIGAENTYFWNTILENSKR